MTKKLTGTPSGTDLEDEYRAMAVDKVREVQATEWTENLVADIADEQS